MTVDKHSQWVELSESVLQAAIGEDLIKRLSFLIGCSWPSNFCLRVVDVLVVTNNIEVAADNHWLPCFLLYTIDVGLESPVPFFDAILESFEVTNT